MYTDDLTPLEQHTLRAMAEKNGFFRSLLYDYEHGRLSTKQIAVIKKICAKQQAEAEGSRKLGEF